MPTKLSFKLSSMSAPRIQSANSSTVIIDVVIHAFFWKKLIQIGMEISIWILNTQLREISYAAVIAPPEIVI